MSDTIRRAKPGDICLVTALTNGRRKIFADESNVKILLQTLHEVRSVEKCDIFSYIILPDHLHIIMRSFACLPADMLGLLQRSFALNWKRQSHHGRTINARSFWQREFWENIIFGKRDLIAHINYIYHNPVKHGYVDDPEDWPYSSFAEQAKNNEMEMSTAGAVI